MNPDSHLNERRPQEYLLFALAVIGFGGGSIGIILSSPGLALTGAVVSLLALWCFLPRR